MMPIRRRGIKGVARSAAFTLIELLVVIAIIAMLIAILLPSLEAARRQSKQSACLSHIKNIATSSAVYEAGDPAGWGIPVHPAQFLQDPNEPTYIGAYEWGGKSGIGSPGHVPGPGADYAFLTSKYGTKAGFGPATRPMNDLLYPGGLTDYLNTRTGFDRDGATRDTELDLGLFRCPADDGPPRGAHCPDWIAHPDRSSFDHFGNSYAANLFLVIPSDGSGCVQSNSPYMRPISRVPNPCRTIYYEENIGRWAWGCMREPCRLEGVAPGLDPGPTKEVRGWHGKAWTYNRSFVDGHAETQKVFIEGTEDANGYANHYISEVMESYPPWRPGCAGGSSPGSYETYYCVIIRGPGWQKDTLPAPLIETHLNNPGRGRGSYESCVAPAD